MYLGDRPALCEQRAHVISAGLVRHADQHGVRARLHAHRQPTTAHLRPVFRQCLHNIGT